MELMMFEAMAMLLVTTARMIIVAAKDLSFRFAIPWTSLGKKNCVLLDSNSSKRKHRIEPSREVGMRISENLL
jgi:hypothetical protein